MSTALKRIGLVSVLFLAGGLLPSTVIGCGDGSSSDPVQAGSDAGAVPDGAKADVGKDSPGDSPVMPDGSDATVAPDGSPDVSTIDGSLADQAVADGPSDGPAVDQIAPEASCQTDLILLATAGSTSSCSFAVPANVDHDLINVLMGGKLCEQGSHNCSSKGGWFWSGDEVALCDDTCLSWENSGAKLYLQVGCPSESCFTPCSNAGGLCGNGDNYCCTGFKCIGGTCATCKKGGESCSAAADCCNGSTCQGGQCIGGLGGTCISDAGCTEGVCENNVCQCGPGKIYCGGECLDFLDPMNCRGCGNVCKPGRICTMEGCVCDPQLGFPDECNGVCVNKSTDRENCGYCYHVCPKLEYVCNSGVCGCPDNQSDCNGNCTDTQTSLSHCGSCNHGCVPGAQVCNAGVCECAPGYSVCSGNCVNLLTDKYNCTACGVACPGNKLCKNGVCG